MRYYFLFVEIYGWSGCFKEFFCIEGGLVMFGIKRKKVDVFEVVILIEGICILIMVVMDEVFVKKMMGDGFVIRLSEDIN